MSIDPESRIVAPRIPAQTEKQFQAAVIDLARVCGFMAYHTHDSRRSEPGFPDLVLCRPPRIIYVELKGETGRVTRAQQAWLDSLTASGAETHVWRPEDWDEVVRTLRR